jgi:predicted amidophosphoribosyltransferase
MASFLIDTLSKNKSIFNPVPSNDASAFGIWNLTQSSVNYTSGMALDDFFIVTEYYQMRPDIIAALKYGDHGIVGSLLKFNSISNPFAIKEGNVLLIPNVKSIDDSFNTKKKLSQAQALASNNTNTDQNTQFKKNQESKKFKVSDARRKFLEQKVKNQPNIVLPPNVLQPDEKTIMKENGFLIFAPSAGGGGFNKPIN